MKLYNGKEVNFRLHKSSEHPAKSCIVIAFFHNDDGNVYSIQSISYSKRWDAFNAFDFSDKCENAFKNNFYWDYID